MIIVVHSLYFVIQYALRWYRKQQVRESIRLSIEQRQQEAATADKPAAVPLDPEECFVFPIPVYRQRYSTVQDILLDPRWRKDIQKVVDFGCAEFGFFQYLKHLLGVTDILEVDIDETLLKENMFRVQPLTADYLKQRTDPLTVEILRGSVSDPDWRIKGIDAVVGIEIIEHLYPDILDALPYNIFGFAQPKLVIITTPNADFNVLFPNFKGFRHDDHKFEWSREQFEDWALNIVSRYPNYSVSFAGIGKGPKGTESLGCCSQMAVFVKEFDTVQSEIPELSYRSEAEITEWRSVGVCTHYSFSTAQMTLLSDDLFAIKTNDAACAQGSKRSDEYYTTIDVVKYPYSEDLRTPDEKLLHEATQQIFRHASTSSQYFNEDTGIVEIPLYEVVKNFEGTFTTQAEIKIILEAAKFKIAECTLFGSDERCLCVRYDLEMAGHSSDNGSEYEPPDHLDLEDAERDDDDPWNAHVPRATNDKDNVGVHHRNINSSNDSDWELEERVKLGHASKDEAATPSDPLVDSGYQKSLSNAEWSPQSPIDGHFDEQFVPRLDVNDIKESIKARLAQAHNGKVMNNRLLSEWRWFSGGCGGGTAPPSLGGGASKVKSPTPGTSRRRKTVSHAGAKRTDSEDSNSAKDDVRSIADVIMYNSLNKLNVDLDIDIPAQVVLPVERPQELPLFIVENGDLANNNRDGEGNNYPEVDLDFVQNGDDPNENHHRQHNEHAQDEQNRNVGVNLDEGVVADVPPLLIEGVAGPAHIPVLEIVDVHHAPLLQDQEDEEELNHASREALFDPNSQSDFLEDGSITDDTVDFETDAETTDADVEPPPESVTPVNNLFPNWLLQLLGGANYVAADVEDAQHAGDEDEPHFYCQGDGLGVHPSIVDVDVETSSNSSLTDEAQAERTISENDVGSLPTDGVGVASVTTTSASDSATATLAIFGRALDIPIVMLEQRSSTQSQDSGGEEFYDTVATVAEHTATLPSSSRHHDHPPDSAHNSDDPALK